MKRSKKAKVLSFLLCIFIIFTTFTPMPIRASEEDEGNNKNVIVTQEEKTVISAPDNMTGELQWQYYSDEYNMWINIYGENGDTCTLTYAKVYNMLDSNGQTQVRCIQTTGETEITSDIFTVILDNKQQKVEKFTEFSNETTVIEPIVANATLDNYATATTSVENTDASNIQAYNEVEIIENGDIENKTYSVVINYVFENNQIVADSYTATLAAGSNFSATVNNPTIQGYLPYIGNNTETSASVELNYTNIQNNDTITVTYKPTNVDYTVIHYQQNSYNDEYTLVETETKQGLTKSTVPEVAKTYEGFIALLYERPEIAADGSTVVEVYYDREYYLMMFGLDGGYGVEPIYARYGATIGDVGTPTKAGSIFKGWSLDGTTTVTMPSTMPSYNVTYTALWEMADTTYTVVYWVENADDSNYSYIGSKIIEAISSTTVSGADDLDSTYFCGLEEHIHNNECMVDTTYYEFVKADTDVVVNGDGSTVINVYYTRKAYTLRFYYARSDGKNYYVVGGSTYGFGALNSATTENTSTQTLLENVTDWGKVENVPTVMDEYKSRYTISSVTYGIYEYYYLEFTAKYGSDLSELWAIGIFNPVKIAEIHSQCDYEYAYFSAWNGEYRVKYTQDHNSANGGNETIKGCYMYLDENVIFDSQFADVEYTDTNGVSSNLVSFLGFWDNGSNTSWSIPELYIYNLMVESLDGSGYELYKSFDTYDDSNVENQTPTNINGFTYKGYDYKVLNDGSNGEMEKYSINFYYTRNSYEISFYNYSEVVSTENLIYGNDLSDKYFVPDYPVILEQNGYQFKGWYTTKGCYEGTEFNFNSTMPANNLILYAKWVPVKHNVEIYLDSTLTEQIGATQIINHRDYAVAPETPENGNYIFTYWFYMDGDVEKAFDFETMQITNDMKIYAKWSSNTLKPYIVRYKVADTGEVIGDTEVWVADVTEGSALVGTTKTFEAKGGTELYANYQEGYFPLVRSHSFIVDIEGDNEYTFEYVKKDEVPYTVKYLNSETGEPVATEKIISDNHKAIVTETFVPVSGMMPDAYQKRLVLSAEKGAVNEIIFYYTKDETHAYYKITHYTQNLDGETWTEYASSQIVGVIGETYPAEPLTISGFRYDSAVEGTVASGKLTANGLELKLYYTRNSYPYEVRYLEQDTGKQLAEPKTGTGKYGKVVSESAIDIKNYDLVSDPSQTFTIRIEEGSEAKLNIITFYYKEHDLTNLTITKSGANKIDENQSFIFNIKGVSGDSHTLEIDLTVTIVGNSSITIKDLPIGTYTVTEDTNWSWRYSPVSNPQTITVTTNVSNNNVVFENKREKIYWLNGNAYKDNEFWEKGD